MTKRPRAILALSDGTCFSGEHIGFEGVGKGEVVFNTSMTGYQEIVTDPSYAYQMLTFTCPHIGNVGVNTQDVESNKVHVAGVIVRQLSEHYSNFRATGSFEDYLRNNRISGIQNVDTRSLVLHLRTHGSQMGVIGAENQSKSDLVDIAKSLPTMDGLDLAKDVSTKKVYLWNEGVWSLKSGIEPITETESTQRPHVVAMDFGIKFNILRLLVGHGFRVTVVPADTTAEQIIKLKPDGLFLSNGPGDPAAVSYAIETVRMLLGKMPIFGICLGHQILGLAFNAPTFKLKFGHRGGNHPVRNELTGKVEITVQNHGFATSAEHVPSGVKITHINLNDNTIEGLEVSDISAFSVQYHPESSPGPHDALYLFKKFRDSVDKWIN